MSITDEMLYQHAGEARDLWLSTLPRKDDLEHVPYSNKFKRNMNVLMKTADKSSKNNRVVRYLRRSIAAVLVIATVSFGSLMTVKAYREKVIEIVVQVFHELTQYRFISRVEGHELSIVEFGFLPEDLEFAVENNTDTSKFVRYTNADGDFFELTQVTIDAADDFSGILDTEDSVIERFEIRGNEAIANTKHGATLIFWTEGNEIFELYGNITVEELKTIAKNLKILEN